MLRGTQGGPRSAGAPAGLSGCVEEWVAGCWLLVAGLPCSLLVALADGRCGRVRVWALWALMLNAGC